MITKHVEKKNIEETFSILNLTNDYETSLQLAREENPSGRKRR